MASIAELKGWFERDIRFATWTENVQLDEADQPQKAEIRLYTDTNEYLLTVTTPEGEAEARIDCTVRARKARAGLHQPRVRRLLPGHNTVLNQRTWRRLLGAIVGMELVRVRRPEASEEASEPVADVSDAR
jgi:hypothetical protein